MTNSASRLRGIKTFEKLVHYLEEELDWPLEEYSFEDLTFEYLPAELGLKEEEAAKVKTIHQLRPLRQDQPWGIFFVEFERKRMPVVVLRRVLSHLVVKKRAAAHQVHMAAWHLDDLLFISAFGDEASDQREIAFAHFHQETGDLPTLRVLGWDGADTPLKLDHVAATLKARLCWPTDPGDADAWRQQWSPAFRHRLGHVIRTADALAERLALLARGIRDAATTLMDHESERGLLRSLHQAFQTALIHDLSEADFADTYAQTITYGLLTAAISRTEMSEGRYGTALIAQNVTDMVPITNPFLREMLQTFIQAGGRRGGIDFDELGIQDVVDLLRGDETDLPAILRDFGNRTRGEDPVMHFYEHFLAAYDKRLKIKRGIFYTPQPVVSYIVRSVHELLQTEFGLEDGLASTVTWGEMAARHPGLKIPDGTDPQSPFVVILDPATGTATFLVEVIDVAHYTMTAKWTRQGLNEAQRRAAWNEYVPKHLLPRLYGYELMMAPYAIAHMKIGLKLYETGYRFGSDERVRVYLTNALEPASDEDAQLAFAEWAPALAHEAQAVNAIKRHQRFTVVIGNPPYSGESANKIQWIALAVKENYQRIDGVPLKEKGKKNWLLDDYVKFLHLSHFSVVEAGFGVVGHIINNAFQDNPTFRGLRHCLLNDFSNIQILDLHGSGTRNDSVKEAETDENVFDIRQGVCVLILTRPLMRGAPRTVVRGDLWGRRESKYRLLSDCGRSRLVREQVEPRPPQWFFISLDLTHESEWAEGIGLLDTFPVNGNGLISAKDHFAYGITLAEFQRDLGIFLDPKLTDKQVAERLSIKDNSMWSLHDGRLRLRRERASARFCRIAYRPFDTRFSLFHRDVIFNLRLPVTQHIVGGKNLVLLTTRMTKGDEWRHCFVTQDVSDCAFLSNKTSTNAFAFPLYQKARSEDLFSTKAGSKPNLSSQFMRQLASKLGVVLSTSKSEPGATPEDIFHYAYAVFHSPGYRSRYAEFLKIDFPRLPLTSSLELFRALARLGGELVVLHLMESPILSQHVTTYIGPAHPQVEKASYARNTVWLDKAQTRGFRGVPEAVWNFRIGGYQVCEKWLKDRGPKKGKPGRILTPEDIEHYHRIVVVLKETIRLMEEIDEVIEAYGGWPIE